MDDQAGLSEPTFLPCIELRVYLPSDTEGERKSNPTDQGQLLVILDYVYPR